MSLLVSALYAKSPYYLVLYLQSVTTPPPTQEVIRNPLPPCFPVPPPILEEDQEYETTAFNVQHKHVEYIVQLTRLVERTAYGSPAI